MGRCKRLDLEKILVSGKGGGIKLKFVYLTSPPPLIDGILKNLGKFVEIMKEYEEICRKYEEI